MANATWSETWRRLFKATNRKNPAVSSVTVGTSAVLLATGTSTMLDRGVLEIYNTSSAIIYLGPSTVTTSDGIPLLPNDVYYWYSEDDLYAIAESSGNAVRVIETR